MLCKIAKETCPEKSCYCCECCPQRENCDAVCFNCSDKCGLAVEEDRGE